MVSFGSLDLGDDRVVGMFQLPPTDFPGGDYADFYAHVFRARQQELQQSGQFRLTSKEGPDKAIDHCTIRTEYRPLYRIHHKEFFEIGPGYMGNWESSERKRGRAERYSPYGTEGFYFGWTLRAAEDEVRYYSVGGQIDAELFMIVVIEACLDNVLYLSAGCIDAVWDVVGLGANVGAMDRYMAILDPATDNPVTNTIGLWARERGLNGIVYPSARYGQDAWIQQRLEKGFTAIPAINFLEMGSHLCHNFVAHTHARVRAMKAIKEAGGLEHCIPVWADPNLVLFDGSQVSGEVRGVVYQTFPLTSGDEAVGQDDAGRQARSFTYWTSDEEPPWLPETPNQPD